MVNIDHPLINKICHMSHKEAREKLRAELLSKQCLLLQIWKERVHWLTNHFVAKGRYGAIEED
jgi:hypothetical protein